MTVSFLSFLHKDKHQKKEETGSLFVDELGQVLLSVNQNG